MTSRLLVLGSDPGPVLHLSTLGATVRRLDITGGDNVRRDVTLGYAGDGAYLAGSAFLGATIGRYANRIAHGRFPLDGREIQVGVSDRGHALHGGPDGFDRREWDVLSEGPDRAVLGLVSPDGDQGYPGELRVEAAYAVTGDTIALELTATTDAPTVVNLTSHLYLNLAGGGTVDDHLLWVPADHFTPVDPTGIPLERVADVTGTPFDFREPWLLGDAARSDHPQVAWGRGLDHDLVPRGSGWRPVARLDVRHTRMTLWSDAPGLQVFTANTFDGSERSSAGRLLRQGDGVALEPQHHPDTPNRPDLPSAVLRPGEVYRRRIEWRFEAARRA